MKTYQQTVRVGERTGNIDWDYNFDSHEWNHGGCINPNVVSKNIERLRELEAAFKAEVPYEATTYGGWPRCGWGKVIDVGMYDGWPYWKPTPSIFIMSYMGGDWHSWLTITDIRKSQPTHDHE